jgi:hypothetical protein
MGTCILSSVESHLRSLSRLRVATLSLTPFFDVVSLVDGRGHSGAMM